MTHWYLDTCEMAIVRSGIKLRCVGQKPYSGRPLYENRNRNAGTEYPCVSTFNTALEDGWKGKLKVCVLGMPGSCEHEKSDKLKGSALMRT